MAFLPPTEHVPPVVFHEEPFRFTRKLPLILTKLTPPRTPGVLLPRARLLHRLDEAASGGLTLVCAPAGFGKTTLLAQWYRHRQQQGDALAWLSLEDDDSTPLLFMRYLLAALRPLYQGWSDAFQTEQNAAREEDVALLLAELVNQLHACPHPLYLILDDYQSIQDPQIHAGVSWLLSHAPAALHLIIGSRSRPALALSRLQVQDQLVEIDDRALRFTPREAQDYFTRSVSPPIGQQEIPQLITLTEGWVAGMKMATFSSPGSDHPQAVDALRAGSRSITRYLDEVVFSPLPPEVLHFLMYTSVLNRLHPALCDAVTGMHNGAQMLAWTEQHNLFLSALDDRGLWFRYHPLLRDALTHRLGQHAAATIPLLHERAANWFADRQLWAEAIRHALAAGKSVTRHAEAGAQSLAEEGDIETMVRWIRYLPATPDPSRIELQLNLAWALAHHFRFHDARQLLDAIDAMVAGSSVALARSTWVKQRVVRAICEAFADNITQSLVLVEPLLAEVPCGDIWVDGLVCNILSYCHLAVARSPQALAVQQRYPGSPGAHRNLFVAVYRALVLAQAWLRQGNLPEAERHAAQALHHAEKQTGVNSSSGATLAPVLAHIAWLRGDTARAGALLTPRLGMIDDVCPPDGLSRCYIILARQARLNGQPEAALALLAHAGELCLQRGWLSGRIALLAERLDQALDDGQTDTARALLTSLQALTAQAREAGSSAVGWHAAVCESRILLAEGRIQAAITQLDVVIGELEAADEWLLAIPARLMLANACWHNGETARAVSVATPALKRVAQQNLRQYLHHVTPALLSAPSPGDPQTAHLLARIAALGAETALAGPALRLTEREQQTLRLIAEGHSNKGIARALGISAETVKWHLKQLYEKLQVSGRIQAVNQARKWQLLN